MCIQYLRYEPPFEIMEFVQSVLSADAFSYLTLEVRYGTQNVDDVHQFDIRFEGIAHHLNPEQSCMHVNMGQTLWARKETIQKKER